MSRTENTSTGLCCTIKSSQAMRLFEQQRPRFDWKEVVKGRKSVWNVAIRTLSFSTKQCPRMYHPVVKTSLLFSLTIFVEILTTELIDSQSSSTFHGTWSTSGLLNHFSTLRCLRRVEGMSRCGFRSSHRNVAKQFKSWTNNIFLVFKAYTWFNIYKFFLLFWDQKLLDTKQFKSGHISR